VTPHAAAAWTVPRVGARPSERALTAVGALCLKAFLLAQFVSLTRLFLIQRLGDGFATLATQAGLLSVALLLPAVLAYGLDAGRLLGRLVPGARAWVIGLVWLTAFLFLYGWLGQGYALSAAVHDLAPYLVIVSAVVLGSMPRVWQDTDGLILALFAAALVVNAVGMTEITHVVSESYAEDRAGVSTVAYRTQGALAFWPLLLLTARARRPRAMLLIFAGVFFVLAQQILFQKRAPILRVASFLLVFLLVLPWLWARGSAAWTPARERKVRALFLGTAAAALVVALALAPWLFQGQLLGLVQRLSGQAYSGGPAAMLTWENERFFEAGMFLSTVEPHELVVGRGFGGYFIPEAPGWGVWLDDLQEFGRRQLHVGLLMPFFKGGLALSLVYYAGLCLALSRGPRALREPLGMAAFFIVLLHTLFLLQEGWFIMSVSFDLVMVGLCLGHLMSSRFERRAA
jgi:hypothetical protein